MRQITTLVDMRAESTRWHRDDLRIALVPTMGNLHAGHVELVRQALQWVPRVIVSIFVNPMQFGPAEDYASYPRTLDADLNKLTAAGVHVVFTPNVAEMVAREACETTRIEVPGLSNILCGAYRPGHFAGVATVVAKLFNITAPDLAFFGEKDFQQLLVVKRMVQELAMPVEIHGVPTVREPSGLALSSRNGFLTPKERELAPMLYRTLAGIRSRIMAGERNFSELETDAQKKLQLAGFNPQYVSVRRARDLGVPVSAEDSGLVVLAAAYLGKTRLIDNVPVDNVSGDNATVENVPVRP